MGETELLEMMVDPPSSGTAVNTYSVIAVVPVSEGALKLIIALPSPTLVAVKFVGAPGAEPTNVTDTVAVELVTLPAVVLATTVYDPASETEDDPTLKLDDVAPSIGLPSKNHCHDTGALLDALALIERVSPTERLAPTG
tara:strand:+ start:123 stop:542 length:420 start_codon:yes stop_codon:yes gene_type:complete